MSLQIKCPHCGVRPVEEYVYGEVPNVPDAITDPVQRHIDRVFMVDNTEGVRTERWFHAFGCSRWLQIRRDRTTDEIFE